MHLRFLKHLKALDLAGLACMQNATQEICKVVAAFIARVPNLQVGLK